MSKLRELIEHVRQNSPFYSEQWRDVVLPQDADDDELLRALPVTDHKAYWEANTCRDSRVLTAPQGDGIIFKTGGEKRTIRFTLTQVTQPTKLPHMLTWSFYQQQQKQKQVPRAIQK